MSNICWACSNGLNTELLCPSCHKIQPPADIDAFQRLGLKTTFAIDMHTLQKHYFKAQNLVHPDRYTQAPPAEKNFAHQQADAINAAYKILKDPVRRAEVLLDQAGLKIQAQSPMTLSTMMEWQEKIAETSTPVALQALAEELATVYQEAYQRLQNAFTNNITTAPELAGHLLYLSKAQQHLIRKMNAGI